MRLAAALLALALTSARALAHAGGALGPVGPCRQSARCASDVEPPYSRAQLLQTIRDRGYFEVRDLRRSAGGTWQCTAMAGVGDHVRLEIGEHGTILGKEPLPRRPWRAGR